MNNLAKIDTYKDISPTPVEVNTEDVVDVLTEEAVDKINEGFGKGVNTRKMLVTKGITLKELVQAIDE